MNTEARYANARNEARYPNQDARRKGADEKDVIPSTANFSIFRYGYLVSPAWRASR
jgi:hypothetical protein